MENSMNEKVVGAEESAAEAAATAAAATAAEQQLVTNMTVRKFNRIFMKFMLRENKKITKKDVLEVRNAHMSLVFGQLADLTDPKKVNREPKKRDVSWVRNISDETRKRLETRRRGRVSTFPVSERFAYPFSIFECDPEDFPEEFPRDIMAMLSSDEEDDSGNKDKATPATNDKQPEEVDGKKEKGKVEIGDKEAKNESKKEAVEIKKGRVEVDDKKAKKESKKEAVEIKKGRIEIKDKNKKSKKEAVEIKKGRIEIKDKNKKSKNEAVKIKKGRVNVVDATAEETGGVKQKRRKKVNDDDDADEEEDEDLKEKLKYLSQLDHRMLKGEVLATSLGDSDSIGKAKRKKSFGPAFDSKRLSYRNVYRKGPSC